MTDTIIHKGQLPLVLIFYPIQDRQIILVALAQFDVRPCSIIENFERKQTFIRTLAALKLIITMQSLIDAPSINLLREYFVEYFLLRCHLHGGVYVFRVVPAYNRRIVLSLRQ